MPSPQNESIVPEAQEQAQEQAQPRAEAPYDDDDISITSTDHEGDGVDDADKDWVVDDLLAERPHPYEPGRVQYLIKWEDYPLEDCTWEPVENLGPGLLTQWEETKKEIEAGIRPPFDLEEYNKECMKKAERHMRRNAKRKRLGLPLTEPFPEDLSPEPPSTPSTPVIEQHQEQHLEQHLGQHLGQQLTQHHIDSSSDEAEEMNEIEPDADTRTLKRSQKQKNTGPKTASGIPSKAQKQPSSAPASKAGQPSQDSLPKTSSEALKPTVSSKKTAGARATGGTMTGYQGTARKPNTTTNQSASKTVDRKPSGQKQMAQMSRPPLNAGTAPAKSPSSTNKFAGKQLTATRTRPQPAAPKASSNIFIGGKKRKQRQNLADAMIDPTRAPKKFTTLRVMNIAHKKAVEKSDATANYSSIPQSFFLNNDTTVSKSKENNPPPNNPITSQPDLDQAQSHHSPMTTPITAEAPSPTYAPITTSPVNTSNPAPAPRKKKSVRFTEVNDEVPDDGGTNMIFAEPMEIDYPSEGPNVSHVPPTGPKKLSLATYQEREHSTQVVSRTITLGPSGSQELRVMFSGISRHGDSWLSTFITHDSIHFNTTCASYNFLSQKGFLVSERLCAGSVEPNSKEQAAALENAAERLRQSSLGMHLVTPEYSILLYPSKCCGWKDINIDFSSPKPDAPLRHLIYRSSIHPKLYPLLPSPIVSNDDPGQEYQCQLLVKELTGLCLDSLLPQDPALKDNQVFMLLFPHDEAQALTMIKYWLQSCRPACRIFSNENLPDGWLRFHECVKAGAAGTVIVHSKMIPSFRKIPYTQRMLEGRRYTFWDLSLGEFNPPLYPSYPRTSIEPGTLQMTRLFPFGCAILITPSFVLSEPDRLCTMLLWFRSNGPKPHQLIVACANFPKYLRDVTMEKEREHKALCDKNIRNLDKVPESQGRRREDIEATYRAWELLQDIMKTWGDEKAAEDVRKVFWAPDFIDPNDEQSLVNYFLWWSTTKMDFYRRFYVLGSSSSSIQRAFRWIPIPAYTDDTISDPDVAATLQDQRVTAAREGEDGNKISVLRTDFKFPSTLFETDRAQDLKRWIMDMSHNHFRKHSWSNLHVNPVSWVDVPMADQFGDALCSYDTFRNWLSDAPVPTRNVNTWFGLFYTINEVWDPREPLRSYKPHPWIAIYRPVDPHYHPEAYSKMELFIWDIAAGADEPNRGESGCLDMQHRLINLVREETPRRNKDRMLERVWVGSMTDLKYNAGDSLLDITCSRIKEMFNDTRNWLPPFGDLLERDWRELPKSMWEGGMAAESRKRPQREISRIPRNASDKGKAKRIIWHPPRGKVNDGESTVCLNALYKSALEARRKDPLCQTMRYEYRPTNDWYSEQTKEHRDVGYVYVGPGEKVVNKMRTEKS
ncbi:hypothetical protein F4810DRAFT_667598 [Camillea tinctor]|nr:hypothetical protein F4810DRAFT_667598 [Camillea tinctor]